MQVVDGLNWEHIYFTRGMTPRLRNSTLAIPAIRTPPCAGWSLAFVLPGSSTSIIFSPFELQAFSVPNTCAELEYSKKPLQTFNLEKVYNILLKNWTKYQKFGFQRDYAIGAKIFKMLNKPIPNMLQISSVGDLATKKKGGKPVAKRLLKPVKVKTRRGKILQWFLTDPQYTQSILAIMTEFSITRSNALSMLFMLNKEHGIGYDLIGGDTATVILPINCIDPFTTTQTALKMCSGLNNNKLDEDNDDWLN